MPVTLFIRDVRGARFLKMSAMRHGARRQVLYISLFCLFLSFIFCLLIFNLKNVLTFRDIRGEVRFFYTANIPACYLHRMDDFIYSTL